MLFPLIHLIIPGRWTLQKPKEPWFMFFSFAVGWPMLNSKQKLRQTKLWRRSRAQRSMVVPWSLTIPVRRANKKTRKVHFQICGMHKEERELSLSKPVLKKHRFLCRRWREGVKDPDCKQPLICCLRGDSPRTV